MAFTDNEQLQLVSPEYTAALLELTEVATEVMNRNPQDILYYRPYSRLPLKTPGCTEGEYYVISKSLPFPYPDKPDWSTIMPSVSKVVELDSASGYGYTVDYSVEQGILTSKYSAYENNETYERGPSKEMSLEEVEALIGEIRTGIPFNDQKEVEVDTRKTHVGRFLSGVVRRVTRRNN